MEGALDIAVSQENKDAPLDRYSTKPINTDTTLKRIPTPHSRPKTGRKLDGHSSASTTPKSSNTSGSPKSVYSSHHTAG